MDQVVIVKAAYIDSIPNSYGGSKIKLLAQYYGRPVKDTFNFIPGGTDCDLYLRDFHKFGQDTLFLILRRQVSSVPYFDDTVRYSLSMCGKHFATVRNDSVFGGCSPTLTASALADSLRHHVQALGIATSTSTQKVTISPNPVSDRLTIEGAKGATGILLNSIGQAVMQFSINTDKQVIDVNAVPAGTYLLQLTDGNGNRQATTIIKN